MTNEMMTNREFADFMATYRDHPGWPLLDRRHYVRVMELFGTPLKDPSRLDTTIAISQAIQGVIDEVVEKFGTPPGKVGYIESTGWDDDPLSLV